ncbi:hypothetical protein H5410_031379 [Solanum commersonii]|uniref:Uncharacterized protein n=1 Tax=Solanum commersonii TaxID=4109 RepID=A0A9J5YI83_SOLCO|nr:hypothetical protein H5410_031379 [Solanum commersonii]
MPELYGYEIIGAFWNRKKHIVTLPYEDEFSENDIPTKSHPCQMNTELIEFCKKEIDNLLQKGLIKPSKSPLSCTIFYVNNATERERGVPRLVINYKPLNKHLKWIRMDPPWITKSRGMNNNTRGRSSPCSSYRSSSNSPVIQMGRRCLINSKVSQSEASSSVHLEDIPENSSLCTQLQAYLSQKKNDTFALIAKEDNDDIKSYEKLSKKEMIFHLENFEIQRKEEPWKMF